LDLAAVYLNQQPGAERLRVVCEYAGFGPLLRGHTLPARRFEEGVTDYVVLYANQWQRHLYPEPEAALAGLSPAQVVRLNGMEVARSYAVPRLGG